MCLCVKPIQFCVDVYIHKLYIFSCLDTKVEALHVNGDLHTTNHNYHRQLGEW